MTPSAPQALAAASTKSAEEKLVARRAGRREQWREHPAADIVQLLGGEDKLAQLSVDRVYALLL